MDINELCINCFNPTGGEEVCMHCGFIQSDKPRHTGHLYPHTVLNDRYIIGAAINNGGFGVIYKAYDTKLESIVAVKELFPTQNGIVTRMQGNTNVIPLNENMAQLFARYKERFLDEARTLAQFSECDSIVRVFDFFEQNNTAYLVMEYLDGMNLKKFLALRDEPIPWQETVAMMKPILVALETIHSANVIHKDISPDNIFITNDKKIKLIDFGEASINSKNSVNETIVLKPGFSPPEQYTKDGKIGVFTDIYSMGAVFYTMLTGSVPVESIDRIGKDELQRPSKLGIDLPPYLEKAVMKAMAVRDGARFKNVRDFSLAVDGKKKSDFPEVELKRRKIRRGISIALVIVLLIGSVFGVYLYKKTNPLLPKEDTEITVWYVKNGELGQEGDWKYIAERFTTYTEKQEAGVVTVNIKEYDPDEYEQALESASADEKPDVYVTDYAGINADTDDAYSFSVASSSSDSLKTLYNQIDAENDDDDSKYTVAFDVMKSALEEQGKFAVSYDMPVLYVKDGSDDVSASSFSELFASESNALLTNPNAVLDIAYSYGYTESNSDELSQIYSTAQDDAYKTFCTSSKKTYYAGYISEYSEIADRCDTAFSVIPLPGANDNYIFPEVWSISDTEDSDKHKASMLFLYYMLNVSTTQQLYTELTGYMPMLLEYINSDSFEAQGAFASVLSSANEAVTYTSSYSDIYDKSIIISKGAEKGKKFSKLELG